MVGQPYHKYVFDVEKRKFIGRFEQMYQNEDKENYDSWFQENLSYMGKRISLLILDRYNFNYVLDVGCGKGAFTNLLKKKNHRVVGVDISETAIKKARAKYEDVEFMRLTAEEALNLTEAWGLIVAMEVLSYLRRWKKFLAEAAKRTSYLYLSLYIPRKPIGFVKNLSGLRNTVKKYFNIETEIIWNKEHVFILGKSKREVKKI